MKFNTLIKFDVVKDEYIKGIGNNTTTERFKVKVSNAIETDCLYCEWSNNYGSVALMQQQQGIRESARIRMPFVRSLVEAVKKNNLIIYKHGIEEDTHIFELATSVDDIKEDNKVIEFQVRRMNQR